MEEMPPWILCLSFLMNLLHQHIHHSFLIKWSCFLMDILLNLITKTINHSNTKIKKKIVIRWNWRHWPLFFYDLDMSSEGVACIWDHSAERSSDTATSINRSSTRRGLWWCNIATFHDDLGVIFDVHMFLGFCVEDSISIRQLLEYYQWALSTSYATNWKLDESDLRCLPVSLQNTTMMS